MQLICFIQTGSETKLEKAQITLNDCLACSGCITSAESVLITQQSQEELYRVLQDNLRIAQEDKRQTIIVSVSPQARASLAAKYKLSISESARKLTAFFKKLGMCRYRRAVNKLLRIIFIINFKLMKKKKKKKKKKKNSFENFGIFLIN